MQHARRKAEVDPEIFFAKTGTKKPLVDEELAAKLHSELELEKDIRDSDQLPSNIQDYLDSGPFAVSS